MEDVKSKPAGEVVLIKSKRKEISPHEKQFVNQIEFLNQTAFLNLVEFKNEELCRQNQHNIKELTNKKPIKLSPGLKYFYCKKCEIMLIPESKRVAYLVICIRCKARRETHIVSTCLNCENLKRYNLINRNKKSDKSGKQKSSANKVAPNETKMDE